MLIVLIIFGLFVYLLKIILYRNTSNKNISKSTVSTKILSHSKDKANNYDSKKYMMYVRQLKNVKNAGFHKKPLMNKEEYPVFREIENMLKEYNKDIEKKGKKIFPRLMAQVNLGEILGSESYFAYESINSKRVDMLIINGDGLPICAIEYQGSGHYQNHYELRDKIKKISLEKAGIKYIEIIYQKEKFKKDIEKNLLLNKIKNCLYEDEKKKAS